MKGLPKINKCTKEMLNSDQHLVEFEFYYIKKKISLLNLKNFSN